MRPQPIDAIEAKSLLIAIAKLTTAEIIPESLAEGMRRRVLEESGEFHDQVQELIEACKLKGNEDILSITIGSLELDSRTETALLSGHGKPHKDGSKHVPITTVGELLSYHVREIRSISEMGFGSLSNLRRKLHEKTGLKMIGDEKWEPNS